MNFYPRYPGDYKRKTQDLSLLEHGALTLLLDFQYGTEQALPETPAARYRICCASTRVEKQAVDSVIARFFPRGDNGVWNTRARDEILQARPRIDAAKKNGALGGRRKKPPSQTVEPDGNPQGYPSETQGVPGGLAPQSPLTKLSIPVGMNKARKTRYDPVALLVSRDVPEDLAEEWVTYRKNNRYAVSASVIDSLDEEAAKAGWPLANVLREALARGWRGFKADWVAEGSTASRRRATVYDERAERNRKAFPGVADDKRGDAVPFIDIEVRHVTPPALD